MADAVREVHLKRSVALLILLTALARPALALDWDPVTFVDPFIGTAGHGHTFPGATVPFGMVQLSPDTRLAGWDGCSGYHDSDRTIFGFSHTHLSGTGLSDYGDILLMPGTGTVRWTNGADGRPGYASPFRKETETASPGYYAVTLEDSGVRCELTAATRAGVHRYTFPAGTAPHVLVDLTHRDEVLESSIRVVNDREIAGLRRSRGWAANQRVYFVARFSEPFTAEIAVDDRPEAGVSEASGTNVKAALRFRDLKGVPLVVSVGISAVDEDGARLNLERDVKRADFDVLRHAAASAWRTALGRIEIEGGTPEQNRIFYTALYHTLLQPNVYSDVDGRYRGRDDRVHQLAVAGQQYTVFSLWDTFRAAHPLYTILEPQRTHDFIETMLRQYDEGGLLPVWELAANETRCMIGYHAVSVIADAWVKGVVPRDEEKALAAMLASAGERTPGLDSYRERGYVSGDVESEGVSKTLEYAYDDWCIAQAAGRLGRTALRDSFLARASQWRNLLDPETRLMRPKANGRFKPRFDPAEVDFNFTEANAWQYSFFVPQDVNGQIAAVGGPDAYVALLDSLFEAVPRTTGREQLDITGLYGQYAHGNEPSHHIAYLYAFAGQAWKTQMRVRHILDTMYGAGRDGLVGNEDCGQMSAWYVLSALGFYPVTPGRDVYVIGTPLFPRAEIHFPNGRTFAIRRVDGGDGRPYIAGADKDGAPFDRSFLSYDEILAGGTLTFRMDGVPHPEWGAGPRRQPVSAIAAALPPPAPYVASGETPFRGTTEVTLACPDPRATIRWTRDGAAGAAEAWPAYDGPISVAGTTELRFRAEVPGAPPSPIQEAAFLRIADGRRVVSQTAPSPQYPGAGPESLIDGVRAPADFRLGAWMGFSGTDVNAVVDLGAETAITRAAAGLLQDQNSWIFMPLRVTFETSTDGAAWTPAGTAVNDVDDHAEGAIRKDFAVTFPERRARYLRVTAQAVIDCPAWHKGAGHPAWVFMDEVYAE